MHSALRLPQAHHGKFSVIALGAVLCLASTASLAAAPAAASAPGFSNSTQKDKAVALKLDLGLAMSGDDCEEDYADLLHVAAGLAAKPAAAAAQAAQAPKPAAPAAPVAAVPAVTAPVAAPLPTWEVNPADKTLNAAFARWAASAGWQLVWELPVDYAVTVRTEIHGSFADAVALVAKSMETADMPMKAIFYDGNRVLRIVAKGTQ